MRVVWMPEDIEQGIAHIIVQVEDLAEVMNYLCKVL
jgi:hypothetical protein